MSMTAINSNSRTLKTSLIAASLLFFTLTAWSLSGPLVSGYDSTFHMANIWCAQGEKPEICEDFSIVDGVTHAKVPAELASSTSAKFFNAELTSSSRKSPFYSIMNFFVSKDTTQSVLLIRLLNSFISSFVFFTLLFFTKGKNRTAVLSSWTFTVVPIIMATLWQPNPRSWGYLSVMSSWIFLNIALSQNGFGQVKKFFLWITFIFSLSLALTSRMDATFFCIFACAVVLLIHFVKNGSITIKTICLAGGIALPAFILLRLISSSIQWYTQFSFSAIFGSRQTLFVLIHLPENIADSLGLGLRYPDLGPNSIGIIGVVLFSIALSSWLRQGNAIQISAAIAVSAFTLLSMFQIAFYWPEANEASGVYVAALLTVCIGMAAAYSTSDDFFPNTRNQRAISILLVSLCHALTLYSKFDWGVRASATNDTFTQLSLNGGWWWNSPIGPNVVFLIGALAFPAWLVFSWATVLEKPTEVTV
jgi:hypothetical protein